MVRPHIERLRIENYGCIKDVELKLTPLHALIGPNDSGKSTVLMALRTLTTLAAGPIQLADDHVKLLEAMRVNPQHAFEVSLADQTWRVTLCVPAQGSFHEESIGSNPASSTLAPEAREAAAQEAREMAQTWESSLGQGSQFLRPERKLKPSVAGSVLLRLEPDELRKPTSLIQEGQPLRFFNALGLGLPAIYDAIVTRDLDAYIALNKELTKLFPTVKGLSPKNPSPTTKTLGVQLENGPFVGADFMSEGMLYYLAYAALPHLEPTAVILIEEPENGLHPARIHDVVRILRAISKTTQVVIATHSPLVINELQPDEVTVLTRDPERGTQARCIKDTADFDERSKVYALGELWLSYANGNDEAPLLQGGARP
jgi:ABC-type branched-subunit amino acid transport system ATPase component